MNPTRSILFALATTAFTCALGAQSYAAFVFDRSGSMSGLRSGSSNTRAVDTINFGASDIFWYFLMNPGAQALVYEFHGNSVTQLGGVHTNAATATAALAFPTMPNASGSTPLAAAICEATTGVVALNPGAPLASRHLYVYSDGDENNSPVTSCRAGLPAATSGDHCLQQWPGAVGAFNTGSWQQAVCNLVHNQVQTNFYYFGDFTDAVTPEVFFTALAEMTGGNLTRIPDSSTMPMQNPWLVTGSGCADFHGTSLSMTHDGLPQVGNTVAIGCRTSNPLPFLLGVGLGSQNLDLTSYGAPGCRLYSSWDVMQGFYLWGTNSYFAIPSTPALAGLDVYWQGAQLSGLNNALGLATSNLLRMTLTL